MELSCCAAIVQCALSFCKKKKKVKQCLWHWRYFYFRFISHIYPKANEIVISLRVTKNTCADLVLQTSTQSVYLWFLYCLLSPFWPPEGDMSDLPESISISHTCPWLYLTGSMSLTRCLGLSLFCIGRTKLVLLMWKLKLYCNLSSVPGWPCLVNLATLFSFSASSLETDKVFSLCPPSRSSGGKAFVLCF